MFTRKLGARDKYQERQGRRVKNAPTLSEKFPRLKSLIVDVRHFDSDAPGNSHPLKFEVNVQNAKSVLRFQCPNSDCIRGDFDLTDELAKAVKRHSNTVTGEMPCRGWFSKNTIGTVRCHNVLHYALRLGYLGRRNSAKRLWGHGGRQ
jgi:hypothetical protein